MAAIYVGTCAIPKNCFAYRATCTPRTHVRAGDFYHREDQWQKRCCRAPARRDPVRAPHDHAAPRSGSGVHSDGAVTPRGKDNLASWMCAERRRALRQLIVYRSQAEPGLSAAQIGEPHQPGHRDRAPDSLWDQPGLPSDPRQTCWSSDRGVADLRAAALLRAEGVRIPELKRVVVAHDTRVAMDRPL